MDDQIRKWLFDALQASENIQSFVEGKSYEDYSKIEDDLPCLVKSLNKLHEK